jgi:hypothetical protein
MRKFVGSENLMLLGVLLFGVTTSSVAVGQPVPMDVVMKANAAGAKANSVEVMISVIELKCDKCDATVKKEIATAKQEVAGLKKALDELRDITTNKFVAIGKACK